MTTATPRTAPTVTRRPRTAADEPLLRALFEQSRDDLALLPPALVDLQYRAQQAQFGRAGREVLVIDGVDVGTLVLTEDDDAVQVVDIVIAPAHRRQGIAEAVLGQVIAQAGDRPVRLTVWAANAPARALYERLGFRALSDSDTHVPMQRPPQAGAHE
jgi:ribosomal protein S18 acetylase RimI-like enzyme